jgi:hypothetical protein
MGRFNFNKRKFVRAIKKCGFYQKNQKGRNHEKWFPPEYVAKNIKSGKPSFIQIPRHNELHIQEELIKELKEMGGEELVNKVLDKI